MSKTEVIEVKVNLAAGDVPLHGSLRLREETPRSFSGWQELAEMIASATELQDDQASTGHGRDVVPLELALSPGSPSSVTIRCYLADPESR